MKKDMKRQEQQGREIVHNNHRLDLSIAEVKQMLEPFLGGAAFTQNDIYKAVTSAYYAGLAVGTRNGQRAKA